MDGSKHVADLAEDCCCSSNMHAAVEVYKLYAKALELCSSTSRLEKLFGACLASDRPPCKLSCLHQSACSYGGDFRAILLLNSVAVLPSVSDESTKHSTPMTIYTKQQHAGAECSADKMSQHLPIA